MKKMNKLFVSVLALTLASSSMLLTGCNKENSQGNVDEATSITLTNNSLSMCVGDTFLIGATLSGGNNDTELVYSSTDESVATVNENGFIKALKPGTAEIKAVYGKSIARCKINVELKDNVPTIELKNIADKSIQIDMSTSFEVEPIIKFNNDYYEFEPTFKVSDPAIAEMNGNLFVPKSNGVVYLTVEGSFFSINAISATIEIVIKDNVIIYMKDANGVETNDIYLYSVGQIDEEVFLTEFVPSEFGVVINGTKVESPSLTIDFVNDDNAVSYDSVTHKITSTSIVGSAKYIVTYNNEDNTVVKTFDIYNNKSVFTYKGETIETDAVGCLLPTDVIFKDFSNKTITKATSVDGETEYEVKDGKILGLPVVRDFVNNDVESNQYIVYNDTVGFKVTLKTYSKIVKTVEDLEYFNLKSLNDKFDGYYVVANDIDGLQGDKYYQLSANTRTMGNAYNYYPSIGLLGVFDGRGHTIQNISLGEGGLFGNIGNGGTIKNIGIQNIQFRRETGKDDTPVLACYLNGAILENVYIGNDYISANYNAGLVANNVMSNCNFRNCYFDLQIADMSKIVSKNYGVFGSMCGERKNLSISFKETYKNVVVNSNIPLIHSESNTKENGEFVKFICDVQGHPFDLGDFNECLLVSDITRYYSNDEMASSGNNFERFDANYWSISGGILRWGK